MQRKFTSYAIIVCLLSVLAVSLSSCKKDEPEEEEESKTLSEVRLKSIFVQDFEDTDENNLPWDPDDGPDLWVQVSRQTTVLWESEVHENADQATIYDYHADPSVEFENINEEYTLKLFDQDENGESTLMNSVHFSPSEYVNLSNNTEWNISHSFNFQYEAVVELIYE